jgi:hypothetical protein
VTRPRARLTFLTLLIVTSVVMPPTSAGADLVLGAGTLNGGALGVGIEAAASGSQPVMRDAGDRSLPRLIHYVATALKPGRSPGSLEIVCNAGGAADTSQIVWGWLYRVVAFTNDQRIVSDTNVCVPFPDPNDRSGPPPAPTLPEPPTIGEVWRAVGLSRPVVGVNPVSRGVTGLTTELWSGGARTAQIAATINGFTVTGTARVVEYRFATDEGYLGASGPGDATEPAVLHDFATKGAHTLSVSSVWQATVTMTGPGITVAIPVDISVAVLTATVDYPVVEVRSQLVG